jgi:hypothetical protein
MNKEKKVAILQSNYIPWKGYFDIINSVDEFIIYDDVQYTRRDWRNRNKIVTPNGIQWLTIPVEVKGKYLQKINETKINDPDWTQKHWNTIVHNYSKAAFFRKYQEVFRELYLHCQETMLSQINHRFIIAINQILGISTRISWSSDFSLRSEKSERLLGLCKDTGGNVYFSGPAAKEYLDVDLFSREGVAVEWMDYNGYPPYRQLSKHFEHGVTILDLIFNEGPEAIKFMKSFGKKI